MAARDVLKNFNVFVDGKGFAGQTEEFNAPELALKLEEWRAGGMDIPVDLEMGMEKLQSDFSLIQYSRDVLALYGVAPGQVVPFVAREVLESYDGTTTAVVHTMRGKIAKIEQGTSKAGDKKTLKVSMTLGYYKLQHGDTVIMEIDPVNMVRIVNGVDVLAKQRAALGM